MPDNCAEKVIGVIGLLILLIVVAFFNDKADAEAAAVAETRATAITELHEDGIAAFEGDFQFQLGAFTDSLHPFELEFQTFDIIGVKSTDETEVYHLIDPNGYTATLEFVPNGMPTWRPSYQPGTTEYNFNPKHEILYHHFIDGDLSIRFVPINSDNSN